MSLILENIVIQHCHLLKINDALKKNLIHQNFHVIQIYVLVHINCEYRWIFIYFAHEYSDHSCIYTEVL